ncbi:MAG: serine/threonine protein kinase, partial [Sandaracinaceae bacterium]|nr:serine/threonine protein kinase [Sandaracinaceae bacterium]
MHAPSEPRDTTDAKAVVARQPVPGELVARKYRVDHALGEGGMGTVYAATNVLTGKRVALKWLLPRLARDPRAVARFLREARAAGGIDHPNVVDVYDVGRDRGAPFLVMELLRGEPLTVLVGRRPVPSDTVVEMLMPALRGVAAAHARGIVHRDLKPENIFLCHGEDGRVTHAKVLDFGISTGRDDGATAELAGTPQYMAPEQLRGDEVDRRADVYALGVILYEALTGALPYDADDFTSMTRAHEVSSVVRLEWRGVSPGLAEIVHRAMALRPEERFPDVASLARALEPFGRGARFEMSVTTTIADRAASTTRRSDARTADATVPREQGPTPLRAPRLRLVALGVLSLAIAGLWIAIESRSEPG